MDLKLDRGCHISFDLWLTLIRSHEMFKPSRNQLLVDHFEIRQPRQVVDDTIYRYDRCFNVINQVVGKNLDAYELFLIVLNDLGCDMESITKNKLDMFYAGIEDLFWKYSPVLIEDEIVEALYRLKNHEITFNILSNTGFIKGYLLRDLLNKYFGDTFFSFQLYSDEWALSKPNPIFFEEVVTQVKKMAKKPSDIIHIGDNVIADYDGAKAMGLKAYLFDHKMEKISTILSIDA